MEPASYLLVLGEREAIAWVLREQRMAFPSTPRPEVTRLAPGDELLIYTTRGAFHNPARDRGRIAGRTVVTTPVTALDTPVEIAGRTFPRGCDLRIDSLAPWNQGPELAPLVPHLDAFPKPESWSAYLRRPLVPLTPADARLLNTHLTRAAAPYPTHLADYLTRSHPPRGASSIGTAPGGKTKSRAETFERV